MTHDPRGLDDLGAFIEHAPARLRRLAIGRRRQRGQPQRFSGQAFRPRSPPAPDAFLDQRLDPVVDVSGEEHDAHLGAGQDPLQVFGIPIARRERHAFIGPDQVLQIGLVEFLEDPLHHLPAALQIQAFRPGLRVSHHGVDHQVMLVWTQGLVLTRAWIKDSEGAKFFVLAPQVSLNSGGASLRKSRMECDAFRHRGPTFGVNPVPRQL